jgi:hypothetical protein
MPLIVRALFSLEEPGNSAFGMVRQSLSKKRCFLSNFVGRTGKKALELAGLTE